jgi:hypothetical protein
MKVELRGHHLMQLAILPDEYEIERRSEYGDPYSRNFRKVVSTLLQNPSAQIEVTDTFDDLCKGCPYMNGTNCKHPTHPSTDAKIGVYDRKSSILFGLNPGDVLTSRELLERLGEKEVVSLRLEDYLEGNEPIENYIGRFGE